MKLYCYSLTPKPLDLVPASSTRLWMDEFPGRHAYRCLPLTIANSYGWEILSPCDIKIGWNGGPSAEDLSFVPLDGFSGIKIFVSSNFTQGIVTFHTSYMFRTEPGWNLFVTGPLNRNKDGIAPLTGVVETDWLPYPFTMNWQFTRPGTVQWTKGEPFCLVFPVQQGVLERLTPEIHDVDENPPLKQEFEAWRLQRNEFMAKFKARDKKTLKEAWQKYYFQGKLASSGETVVQRQTKATLNTPVDLRTRAPSS